MSSAPSSFDPMPPGGHAAPGGNDADALATRVVLLAGDEARSDLAGLLAQHAESLDMARDAFDAVGHLHTLTPVQPVQPDASPAALVVHFAVLSQDDALLKDLVDAAATLKAAPRVVLVVAPGTMSGLPSWVWQRIDAVIQEPVTGEAIKDALQAAPPQSSPDASHADPSNAAAPSESDVDPDPGPALGDIDLVDELLKTGKDLRAKAVTMLRQQSGWPEVYLAADRQAIPQDHAQTAVVHDDDVFGYLHTARDTATAQDLAPWAGWLSRWLALEQRYRHLWTLALQDELTGVWNRRYFNRFLNRMLDRAARERFQVTVMIFDIDDFKHYNDRYGHAAGDDILRETALLMRSSVRDHDVVARVGGDEFGVIFWDADEPRQGSGKHPIDVEKAAERFRCAIASHRFPKLGQDARGTLTVSAGLASYPWDGQTPEHLVQLADEMALRSKQAGKNVITLGPGALKAQEDASDEQDLS